MIKQILPVGTKIKFTTGHIWIVKENNIIIFPSTGQATSLENYAKSDYEVIKDEK